MKYRRVGRSGLKVSELALGAWLTYGGSVESDRAERIIRAAVDHGINFIDVADIYAHGEAEKVVGKAIKGMNRSDLVISSKVFWPMSDNINDRGLSRKHLRESIEKTLTRLGTDYLDLYFCHRYDSETEVVEVVRTMEDLIREGKVIYWGTSVWSAGQIERAIAEAKTWRAYRPIVEQPRYNMLDRHIEADIMRTCYDHGIGLTVWSPLAQGLLTGKYNQGVPEGSRGATTQWLQDELTEDNLATVRKLATLAKELGISISQLALAWILRLREISCAITGATRVEQLEENIKASDVVLDEETMERIETILGGGRH